MTLLLDFNNLLYRYVGRYDNLSSHHKKTGLLFGFVTQISYLINLYKPDKIIICGDSKKLKRRDLLPELKMDRKKYSDSTFSDYINESRNYCDDFISKFNLPFWVENGYESDDLLATLVKFNEGLFIIASNDSDLFQTLSDKVSLHKNKGLYTIKSFKKDYPKIEPSQWATVQAIAGNHNNVPNIRKGIGEHKAIKYLTDKELYNIYLKPYQDIINYHLKLTTLPFDDDLKEKSVKIFNTKLQPVNVRYVENWLMREFGIDITKAMSDAFSFLS